MVVSTVMIGAGPAAPEQDGFEAFYRANVDRLYHALAVTLRRDDLAVGFVANLLIRPVPEHHHEPAVADREEVAR